MILSRTPLRISLFGGGSDMPEFYTQQPGAVVSFSINLYIYVGVNRKFDGLTRVSYSKTEIVDDPWKLEHDLVRETLQHFDLKGLEITSISDIPGAGSGLGSSSAFTVGLVKALTAYTGGSLGSHPSVTAGIAYEIERNTCGHTVGKQDHYAAAFGGLHYHQFNSDGSVNSELIRLTPDLRGFLENNVMLFWTGKTRQAEGILKEQAERFKETEAFEHGLFLADCARIARLLLEDGRVHRLGALMDEAWHNKKQLAKISNPIIDCLYDKAREAGALGGKICGAGGGGFILFIAKPEDQEAIEKAIGLRRVRFAVETSGSQIVYSDKREQT